MRVPPSMNTILQHNKISLYNYIKFFNTFRKHYHRSYQFEIIDNCYEEPYLTIHLISIL